MMRRTVAAVAVAGLVAGLALAADVTGKLVKVDAAKNTITFKDDDGKERTVPAGTSFKAFDAKGAEIKGGLSDRRLAAGTNVKMVLTPAGKTALELHLVAAAPAPPPPKVNPKAKTAPPAKVEPKAKTDTKKAKTDTKAKADPKTAPKPATAAEARFGADAKGTLAKLLKVDTEKRTVQVEYEGGRRADLTVPEKAKFIGPRGGMADINDDRFQAGDWVRLVLDAGGKTVSEVHLAYRTAEDK
jgi:hypothetical protein